MRNKIKLDQVKCASVEMPLKSAPPTKNEMHVAYSENKLPEILFITSYPPRECGIATYSEDLVKALKNKFSNSFEIGICAIESGDESHDYQGKINYILNTDETDSFQALAQAINENLNIKIVLIQHEFGLFANRDDDFRDFLSELTKPIVVVFHTVLPNPSLSCRSLVQEIGKFSETLIVMTHCSEQILIDEYEIPKNKIQIIPHGTHLVKHSNKELLKEKYNLRGKKVLSTFGLLSPGKSIETSLEALPAIIKKNPDVVFLIIGKTHPTVIKNEGLEYKNMLDGLIKKLKIHDHVRYVNYYLPLSELLEYLQLTDIYLFTSKDPNQAVSGTFSYALSCGCPIVSTPIPHAKEVLSEHTGILFDFKDTYGLSKAVNLLLENGPLRKNIGMNGLHKIANTSWENSAIAHGLLFERIDDTINLNFNTPEINLDHLKRLTTNFGMIQFCKINQPDIASGYTLDDNARALVAMCGHFELTKNESDLIYITIYFNFIKHCLQEEGYFLNYVNERKKFTEQNNSINLADSNGRAIWALGYLINIGSLLPEDHQIIAAEAETIMQNALANIQKIHSTRAIAFGMKGLYYRHLKNKSDADLSIIKHLADRLAQMYRHVADTDWLWYESYLTYANSILPEAMLCAWMSTGDPIYKETAKTSFDFLLSKTFSKNRIRVITNKGWLHKDDQTFFPSSHFEKKGGEQPIDVAYTILALSKFYDVFKDESYLQKMKISFDWFLGNNHLNQIIYNPCTGGCCDGLEEFNVNLNQGAESTLSYLMARITIEKFLPESNKLSPLKVKTAEYFKYS